MHWQGEEFISWDLRKKEEGVAKQVFHSRYGSLHNKQNAISSRITIFCNTLFSFMAEIKVLDFVYFSFDVGCVQQVVSLFASRLA